ncbi:glycosyltransferase family 39 protein [Cryomorpha ignava]|uniref:Glycosyltransferase family 39 protein n=1 Tax=Cryomorpha ignava TaxID=101383 RepID=A0A7K3WT10_9FLAO|nr:glycosyltransferase family 39 protein [Cryomorpha ignava]NEN24829.1 glycosyltransferase family 39 protein [Cryomorpha ignava]
MKISNKAILFFILIVACVFRFYDFAHIPFTHDEFSALFRTRFSSFHELIERGVRPDGHPAGVQVFLYFWSKIVGWNTWLIKLPFAVAGVLSILLMYRIATLWYNETVGIISAAFLAVMQIMVMYAQIARPYISGHFFVLLMVFFWSLMILKPDKTFLRNSILFVLSAALCAYNHHFSLLMAAIVGFTGLFLIQRKYLGWYILSGVAIFALYIPHLSILFSQLEIGGIESWLAKPTPSFFPLYLGYLFNYSVLMYGLVGAIMAGGFFTIKKADFSLKKFLLFLTFFILPALIGYFYSVYSSAVLQYSVLIFSTPFILFLLFGHISNQKPVVNAVLTLIILAIGGYALIYKREHYRVFYDSPYEKIIDDAQKVNSQFPGTPILIHSHHAITDYYLDENTFSIPFTWLDSLPTTAQLILFLDSASKVSNTFYYGHLSENDSKTIPIIRDYFPEIKWQSNYFNASTYLFSKGEKMKTKNVVLDFETAETKNWSNFDLNYVVETDILNESHAYKVDSTIEWSVSFHENLSFFSPQKNDFIDIALSGYFEKSPKETLVVATLKNDETTVYWGASGFHDFLTSDIFPQQVKAHLTIKLSDVQGIEKQTALTVFLWNKGESQFLIDDFEIARRAGNRVLYGLGEQIE